MQNTGCGQQNWGQTHVGNNTGLRFGIIDGHTTTYDPQHTKEREKKPSCEPVGTVTNDKEENGEEEDGVKRALGGRDSVGHSVSNNDCSRVLCMDILYGYVVYFFFCFGLFKELTREKKKRMKRDHQQPSETATINTFCPQQCHSHFI